MLKKEAGEIIAASDELGWVLEPEAKRLLSLYGIDIPRFRWAKSVEECIRFAKKIGYPVVVKIVSPQALHKSDVGGVVVGIDSDEKLGDAYRRFHAFEGFAGMLVEEMVSGIEMIAGAKLDYQFGPVIMLGMGGTEVEIYRDTTLRMAPLRQRDVTSMLKALKGHELLKGYRGSESLNQQELTKTLMAFSDLVMALEPHFESIDLNPLMCSPERCIAADARIMLQKKAGKRA
jgi:succinyl-CoA synthetase beta subunit